MTFETFNAIAHIPDDHIPKFVKIRQTCEKISPHLSPSPYLWPHMAIMKVSGLAGRPAAGCHGVQ